MGGGGFFPNKAIKAIPVRTPTLPSEVQSLICEPDLQLRPGLTDAVTQLRTAREMSLGVGSRRSLLQTSPSYSGAKTAKGLLICKQQPCPILKAPFLMNIAHKDDKDAGQRIRHSY